MIEAAGLHEQESPHGYWTVIRCLNITWVNTINETTHTHNWIALKKERCNPPLPCLLKEGRHHLRISTALSQSPVRSFKQRFKSSIQWFLQ